jgi:hypothetical protein
MQYLHLAERQKWYLSLSGSRSVWTQCRLLKEKAAELHGAAGSQIDGLKLTFRGPYEGS